MAQVIVGLEPLPLVGYGGLRHLSERLGLHPDTLVKPSAAQALAAVGAALGAPVWQALRWDLEELRVSLFAQELGSRGGVSPKKLAQRLAALT